MRSLSQRAAASLLATCVLLSLLVALVGVLGIHGVTAATDTGNSIAGDELGTMEATGQLARLIDSAYSTGEVMLLTTDPTDRARLAGVLYDRAIPSVESALAGLRARHADDAVSEQHDIDAFGREWTAVRDLLNPGRAGTAATGPDVARAARLTAAFAPLSTHLDRLREQEDRDGTADQATAAAAGTRTRRLIAAAVILAALTAVACARWGTRRIRRALEPAQDQVEFADTLQLAEGEDEAHLLLQQHLQRAIAGAGVTVLNRNNSADRLEAMTTLPAGSPLTEPLAHAEPRSCLAVRSGRAHDQDPRRPPLLGCPVCTGCPGNSACTPLTVGGEVIGAVLVQRGTGFDATEQQRIRDSVGQAAPVLANLRNLAIAELRAATDSLTGLPNKRAVADTLKRMLAQASRTLTPMSLLLLDLDHFKAVNDRYGHPVGDQTLAGVGAALRATVRASDFAGRNGGEEFAVVLPDTDIGGALLAAEKIRAAIAEITLPGVTAAITASVGVATYPDHATSTDRLERLADSALYVAKRSGRNRVEVATDPGLLQLADVGRNPDPTGGEPDPGGGRHEPDRDVPDLS